MITKDGYSKDQSIQPEGIVITWSREMIALKFGLLGFIRYFEQCMATEEGLWLQKARNPPKHDITYVYIIVCNQVRYRCFYGGYETGETRVYNGNGHTFSRSEVIDWPRIVLAGPFLKSPVKRELRGFQGFRYCTKLF